jgi:MFS family permease
VRDQGPPGGRAVAVARRSVYLAFIANGFDFASWASRIPQVRFELRLSPGELGLVLLCIAIGSAVATPASGMIITRLGDQATTALMALISAAGLAVVAVGVHFGVGPVVAGLLAYGFGTGAWDVAMNVQGAAVEQALGRVIMPRFHAGWSMGTVAGAGLGAALIAAHIPVLPHLLAVAVATAVVIPVGVRGYLRTAADGADSAEGADSEGRPRRRHPMAAWTERRTLLIGIFVLCVTIIEGTGNDWLSQAVIEGYHEPAAVGTVTFAVFLAAMTSGRWFGPKAIDRWGRVPVLRVSAAIALGGLLLISLGGLLPTALIGALGMGLGTALGFPVGLSAAADDPRHAAGRVSTAASIGYVAFLAGPPVVGFVADHIGVQHAIAVTGILLVVAFALAGITAPASPGGTDRPGTG